MIECDGTKFKAEGTAKTLVNDWINITIGIYESIAEDVGLKDASGLFASALTFAASIAAEKMKAEGKLPEEDLNE